MSDFFQYSKDLEYLFLEQGQRIKYEKDQHLVWSQDDSDWVFFLEKGLVKVSFTLPDGTNRIIGYFVPGAIFAKSGSFINNPDGSISYTATTNLTTLRMKSNKFRSFLRRHPDLMEEYMNMTLRNQIFLIDRVVYQGEKGLYLKCVRWLLFMAKYYGNKSGRGVNIFVPIKQETAADFLHTTRESTNVVLRKLEKAGFIKLATKSISIIDLRKLKQLVD